MTCFSAIETVKKLRPPRVLAYGPEGIGKSTLASSAPSPIFVQTEDGLDAIDCHRFPLATTYAEVQQALCELQAQAHDYETVVIDSTSALERLIHDQVCKDSGVTSIEKAEGGYSRGYTAALSYWREILAQLNDLRLKKNMVVVLIAHAKVERFEDPEANAYDRYAPRLHKHASALLCEWCDAVLFATRKMRTQSEDAGFGRTRTTAHGLGKAGGERILRTVGSPCCVAKNRYGITEELPLSWAALMSAFSQSQQKRGN